MAAGSVGGRTAGAAGRAGVVPPAVHGQVRRLHALHPGPRGGAAGQAGDRRVLPGGVAMQVSQQALHALTIVYPTPRQVFDELSDH